MSSPSRARREASKQLGLELRKRHQDLVDATGDEAIMNASIPLGLVFKENVEFMIWVLLEFGGVEQMPFQPHARPLPVTPAVLVD